MEMRGVAARRTSTRKTQVTFHPVVGDRIKRGQGTNVLVLLRGLLPTLKRAQRRIAEGILNDPEQFITRSISNLARSSGVSTGSIVLFCKSLGLRGFPALKIALARELAAPVLPFASRHAQPDEGTPEVLRQVFAEHVDSLQQTLKLNNGPALREAARAIVRGRRIVLFSIGLSFPVAYALYGRLRFLGLPSFIESDCHMQVAAAAELGPRDVAVGISLSGNSGETVECLRICQARRVKTICLTNSVESPLARAADIRLYAAPSEIRYYQTPLSSRVSQLALADALLALVGMGRKRQVMRHLRQAEEYLLKHRVGGV